MAVLRTYVISFLSPDSIDLEWIYEGNQNVLAILPTIIEELEENLVDLLPDGWSVVIRTKEEEASE